MIALKSTLLSKWKKLAIFIANQHSSYYVMEYFFCRSWYPFAGICDKLGSALLVLGIMHFQ